MIGPNEKINLEEVKLFFDAEFQTIMPDKDNIRQISHNAITLTLSDVGKYTLS